MKFLIIAMTLFAGINICSENRVFEIDEVEYQNLDQLALNQDSDFITDKSSIWHDYLKIYSFYFSPVRAKALKFLEIGIFQGRSVKLWENYFPNADLHFIDISLDACSYFSSRAKYHIADQENPSQLLNVVKEAGGDFDIIIDDGGHTMQQQIVSFITLFPHLKSGGLYVIEDLHTSYWHYFNWGGGGTFEHPQSNSSSTTEFLKKLIDEVNYSGARTGRANNISDVPEKELNLFKQSILGIHFYCSLCVIIKA